MSRNSFSSLIPFNNDNLSQYFFFEPFFKSTSQPLFVLMLICPHFSFCFKRAMQLPDGFSVIKDLYIYIYIFTSAIVELNVEMFLILTNNVLYLLHTKNNIKIIAYKKNRIVSRYSVYYLSSLILLSSFSFHHHRHHLISRPIEWIYPIYWTWLPS